MNSKKRRKQRGQATTVSPTKRPPPSSLSRRKKLLFTVLSLALFFALLELALATAGVKPLLEDQDPLVGFSNQVPLLVERTVEGQAVMETAPNKLQWFNLQRFPRQKAAGTYRVFCLGGSTTYGRPYDDTTSFPGWLRELLAEAAPDGNWEVLNAGGISYASYRVLRVMQELAPYEPDLFVVYTGHNEYLEERTYRDLRQRPSLLREAEALCGRLRTYALLNRIMRQAKSETSPVESSSGGADDIQLSREVRTRLDGGVGPDAYHRDDPLSAEIQEHFRFNLERMVEVASDVNADLVFVTPAANLADCSPFKSEHSISHGDSDRWQLHFDVAQQAYERQEFDVARQAIESALELDSRHAGSHYLHGQILRKMGDFGAARAALLRARDEDICTLRAPSEIVQSVRDVAHQHAIPLVDFEQVVDLQSENQLAGENWFLDHVHPTIAGNRLLAMALFDKLVEQGVVTRPDAWEADVAQVIRRVEGRIDVKVHGNALKNLAKVLSWAGKTEDANRLALRASAMVGGDAETEYLAGNSLMKQGKTKEAIEKFRSALLRDPNYTMALNSLGSAYFRSGQLDEALESFLRVIELQPEFAPAKNNLGALYDRLRKPDLAIQHYQEAIRLNPRYSKAYNNVGVLLRGQGRLDDATKYLSQALEINPEFAEAHFNLGVVRDMQGEQSLALASYQQAIRFNPEYAPAYPRLAAIFEDRREWQKAIQSYRQALKQGSTSVETGRRCAWVLATCPESSLRNGEAALKIASSLADATGRKDAEVLSVVAAAYAESGNFEEALRWQTEAWQLADADHRGKHAARLDTLRQQRPLSFIQ